jgi:hemoglobin
LTGGPCRYEGRAMDRAHASLQLTNRDFNALAEDLQIAMERARIPFAVQNRLLAILAPMQREIVTR